MKISILLQQMGSYVSYLPLHCYCYKKVLFCDSKTESFRCELEVVSIIHLVKPLVVFSVLCSMQDKTRE